MSIRKSLLTLAATALMLMGFASPTMAAEDGIIRDVSTGSLIAQGTELHAVGSVKYVIWLGSFECHVTAVIKATGTAGTTAQITSFTIPDTTKCTGSGFLAGCKIKSAITTNLPYSVTVTPADLEVTGNMVFLNEYPSCVLAKQTMKFYKFTLRTLKTGTDVVTGTNGHLGTTAEEGEPIAGFELEATGVMPGPPDKEITTTGELELTSPERCTYYLSTN
jgi:hypothetical protein